MYWTARGTLTIFRSLPRSITAPCPPKMDFEAVGETRARVIPAARSTWSGASSGLMADEISIAADTGELAADASLRPVTREYDPIPSWVKPDIKPAETHLPCIST